jgi:hypothetical protein
MSKCTRKVAAGLVALFIVVMSSLGMGPVEVAELGKPDLKSELCGLKSCPTFLPNAGPAFH